MHIEGLDELDNKILETIKNDARLSYSEIGEKVGVSRVCVKNRMAALEQKGVIKGYKTVIDSDAATKEGIKFFLDAEVWHDQFENALAAICSEKCIREVYTTTGDNHVHCVGFTNYRENLSTMVNRLYRESSVKRVSFHVILSTVKDVDGGVDYALRYKESKHLGGEAAEEIKH